MNACTGYGSAAARARCLDGEGAGERSGPDKGCAIRARERVRVSIARESARADGFLCVCVSAEEKCRRRIEEN